MRVILPLAVAFAALSSISATAQVQKHAGDPTELFESRIRPLFAQKCFACHKAMSLGGLQMKDRDSFLKGGNHGPAVVPGHPEQSLLIQAVEYGNPKLQMPPTGKLQDSDIEALTAWVKSGAVWPELKEAADTTKPSESQKSEYVITPEQRKFWSFQPIHKPAVPEVKDSGWVKNDIDRFILAKLEAKGIKPVGPADRPTLIRRATLDLTGLPPTPEEVDAFVKDQAPDAFAKVVDRLLASPHYGERWGRYWLDIARYADSKGGFFEDPYPNAFRYRDWVIQAFNQDMPYDLFVKAQIAADQLNVPNREKLLPALGFQALGNLGFGDMGTDDRVDVVSRGVLGLTVACAQCHNHKYDPIPTKDYYSMLGVFKSTQLKQVPLAPDDVVKAYDEQKKKISAVETSIREFEEKQNNILSDILMKETSRFMVASWKVSKGMKPEQASAAEKVDLETLHRWVQYLSNPNKDHPFLKKWYEIVSGHPNEEEVRKVANEFQTFVVSVNAEKKAIDDRNYVKLGGAAGFYDDKKRRVTELEFMDALKGRLWSDLAAAPYMNVGDGIVYPRGVLYYGPERMGTDEAEKVRQLTLAEAGIKEQRQHDPIERFLSGEWKANLESMYAELDSLKKALPPAYPYLHAVADAAHPANIRVHIRGEEHNLGEEAPRRFLQILCTDQCKPYTQGSGRLELAEALTNAANPLTPRVIVNRIWAWHFGDGIVRTTSNFGVLGERPTNPELLDYLAARLMENHWSVKDLQRQIMLSATYALSTDESPENTEKDAENRLHWRANLNKRVDAETLRDSILFVSGKLDDTVGGPPVSLEDKQNHRRTVYGFINRRRLDGTLSLFDFPDPNETSEGRFDTVGPLQRLYFMNNAFVANAAKDLVQRLAPAGGDEAKINLAYRILFGRAPQASEKQLALQFLKEGTNSWPEYAQVLLSSSEFASVN